MPLLLPAVVIAESVTQMVVVVLLVRGRHRQTQTLQHRHNQLFLTTSQDNVFWFRKRPGIGR